LLKSTILRRGIALASVGWYLMTPPTACDLNKACLGHSSFWNFIDVFRSDGSRHRQNAWRNQMGIQLAPDAALGEWQQIGVFQTLAECQERYDDDQKIPQNEDEQQLNRAKSQLSDEGKLTWSAQEVRSRADSIAVYDASRAREERRVPSDDPRLAR
jgi:hypothetical protein